MREQGFNNDISSSVKTHDEILELLEEIKEFEKRFPEINIDEKIVPTDELLHEEIKPIPIKTEIKKKEKKKKIKNPFSRIKLRSRSEVQRIKHEKQITTIKLILDEQGNLINPDIRKSKPKKQRKSKLNIKNLINLIKRKKEGKAAETTEGDKRFNLSKIKSIFGKVGKIKQVIPGKKTEKKEEKTENEKQEE